MLTDVFVLVLTGVFVSRFLCYRKNYTISNDNESNLLVICLDAKNGKVYQYHYELNAIMNSMRSILPTVNTY